MKHFIKHLGSNLSSSSHHHSLSSLSLHYLLTPTHSFNSSSSASSQPHQTTRPNFRASLFCSLIHLLLSSGHLSAAVDAFAQCGGPTASSRLISPPGTACCADSTTPVWSPRTKSRKMEIDTFCYNTVIWGFCKLGSAHQVGMLGYAEMVMDGFVVAAGEVSAALELMESMQREGDFVGANIVIDEHLSQRSMDDDGGCLKNDGAEKNDFAVGGSELKQNIITYTSVISGYSKWRRLEEALSLYDDMLKNGLLPDTFAELPLMWSVHHIDGWTFKVGKPLEAEDIKLGDMKGVESVLQVMEAQNVHANAIIYSSVIKGYTRKGMLDAAANVMRNMVRKNVRPNVFTYCILIDGYFKAGGKMDEAQVVFGDMVSKGLSTDRVNYTSLMDGFFKVGKESAALDVAEEMAEKNMEQSGLAPNLATYNTMINAYCKKGNLENALKLWDDMKNSGLMPNLITCNTMVGGLCQAGEIDKAMDLLNEVMVVGFHPTSTTQRLCLKRFWMTRKAKSVLEEMTGKGISADTITYNAFICGYCKSSHLKKASELIDEMKERGFVPNGETYNVLVSAHAKMQNNKEAIKFYCEMWLVQAIKSSEQDRVLKKSYRAEAKKLFVEMNEKGKKVDALRMLDGLYKERPFNTVIKERSNILAGNSQLLNVLLQLIQRFIVRIRVWK
ncbi:hypothetical protein C3L33_09114, partial [Rhododendron williamsianum]